jgi:hypothetical protein
MITGQILFTDTKINNTLEKIISEEIRGDNFSTVGYKKPLGYVYFEIKGGLKNFDSKPLERLKEKLLKKGVKFEILVYEGDIKKAAEEENYIYSYSNVGEDTQTDDFDVPTWKKFNGKWYRCIYGVDSKPCAEDYVKSEKLSEYKIVKKGIFYHVYIPSEPDSDEEIIMTKFHEKLMKRLSKGESVETAIKGAPAGFLDWYDKNIVTFEPNEEANFLECYKKHFLEKLKNDSELNTDELPEGFGTWYGKYLDMDTSKMPKHLKEWQQKNKKEGENSKDLFEEFIKYYIENRWTDEEKFNFLDFYNKTFKKYLNNEITAEKTLSEMPIDFLEWYHNIWRYSDDEYDITEEKGSIKNKWTSEEESAFIEFYNKAYLRLARGESADSAFDGKPLGFSEWLRETYPQRQEARQKQYDKKSQNVTCWHCGKEYNGSKCPFCGAFKPRR